MAAIYYCYFAPITVKTAGWGDVHPTDYLRLIAGIVSLTGFILTAGTAQYLYKTIS